MSARPIVLAIVIALAGCADVLDIRTSRFLVESGITDGHCEGTLRVRVLYDSTGSTRDVGIPAGKGVVDHLRAIDAAGGIRGCRLDIMEGDTHYDVESTLAVYRDWQKRPEWNDVATIFGQGTPMTQTLGPLAAQEKKLLMTTAFNGELATPVTSDHDVGVPSVNSAFAEATVPTRKRSPGYPFVFFQGTDYTTAARIAMNFIWKRGAKRVAFFACSTSAFCTDPVDGGKTFLQVLGNTRVARDLAIELDEAETSIETRVETYLRDEVAHAAADPAYAPVDWIWFGNTRTSLARLGRALARIEKRVPIAPKIITDNWGLDELLFSDCGEACVGIQGVQPVPVFGDGSAAGMAKLVEVHDGARTAEGAPPTTYAQVQYVYGYVAVATWRAAVEAALDAGLPVTGDNLRVVLERFQQRSIDGLATLSYSGTDRRPQSGARVYVLGSGGKLEQVGQPISIPLQPDWLGW
jgi:Periplasmic binding protein